MRMDECERAPDSPLSPSHCGAPWRARGKRSAVQKSKWGKRQAAPQLANHLTEHQRRGGAVRLPDTLSYCRTLLLVPLSPAAAHVVRSRMPSVRPEVISCAVGSRVTALPPSIAGVLSSLDLARWEEIEQNFLHC